MPGAASCAEPDIVGPGECALAGGLAIGAGGALIGGVIGELTKTDRWEEVPLDQVSVRVVPRTRGLALGISVAF